MQHHLQRGELLCKGLPLLLLVATEQPLWREEPDGSEAGGGLWWTQQAVQ